MFYLDHYYTIYINTSDISVFYYSIIKLSSIFTHIFCLFILSLLKILFLLVFSTLSLIVIIACICFLIYIFSFFFLFFGFFNFMFTKIVTKELCNNSIFVQNYITDLDGTFPCIIIFSSYNDSKSNIYYYFFLLTIFKYIQLFILQQIMKIFLQMTEIMSISLEQFISLN